MESRTKNSARNFIIALLMQGINIVLAFGCRTVFAKLLAAEYLGLGGLFSNIISVLSLTELGIGNVIIVHLYKPLADRDEDRISKLMNFYRLAYNTIGMVVLSCGVLLLPFLKYLVKSETEIPYLGVYFFLFILQSATSYFFAYKQALLTADQKEYICSLARQGFNVIMNLLQIVFLLITKQYVAYLLISILTNVGTNVFISHIANKKFPFLKRYKKVHMQRQETRALLKDVSSMMVHKIGNTVINSTDNILISSMIGVIYTGLYSNYLLIVNMITQIVNIGLSAVSASVGDFNAQKSVGARKELFDAMRMFSYWIFGMCAICFCCLFQPTIKIWLGEQFLLDYDIVIIISINFFISGIVRIPSTFIDVNGLYTKNKIKPILMAGINLITSIVGLYLWGLLGVFIGTLISYLFVAIWMDPYVLYNYVFACPVQEYYVSLFLNIITVVVIGCLTWYVVECVPFYLLKIVVCLLLSNVLFLIRYIKTKEFKYIWLRGKSLVKQKF